MTAPTPPDVQRSRSPYSTEVERLRARVAELESRFDHPVRRPVAGDDARFRALCDAAPVMIWASGVDKQCNWFNLRWLTFTGRTLEQEVGDGWVAGVHPDDVDQCLSTYTTAFDARVDFRMEYRLRRADGEFRWILDHGAPQFDELGAFCGYVGSCIDITTHKDVEESLERYRDRLHDLASERKKELVLRSHELADANRLLLREIEERERAEVAVAREKELLSVTLDSIAEAVVSTDREGRIVLLNRVAEELTGWSQTSARGRPFEEVCRTVDRQTGRPAEAPVRTALRNGRLTGDTSHVLIARDGTRRDIAENAAPVRDRHLDTVGAVVVFHDLEETKRLEADRFRAQRLDSLGVLAGGLAHDYNNLLTTILGNISLARLVTDDRAEVVERLSMAEDACRQAKRLSDQILTFSDGGEPVRRPIAVDAVVRDATKLASHDSDIRYRFEIDENLWTTLADGGQIGQAIRNVVRNGHEAMLDGGTMTIRATNYLADETFSSLRFGSRYVRVSITDDGTGIDSEDLDRVFDPYFTTRATGTGLGLTTAYSIVRNHGGHIVVRSAGCGHGTTVTLYLPAVAAPGDAASADPVVRSTSKPTASARILLMDDDESVLRTAAAMLEHFGHEVVGAADGAAAVAAYREAAQNGQRFDLVILDLVVPGGVGGKQAVEQLIALDPAVRAIVSSGYSNDRVLADHQAHGFCDVVAKPYDMTELGDVVNRWVPSR